MAQQRDPYLAALARVETKVDDLCKRVQDHEHRLRWITSAALLVVGLVGGPDAVQAIAAVA